MALDKKIAKLFATLALPLTVAACGGGGGGSGQDSSLSIVNEQVTQTNELEDNTSNTNDTSINDTNNTNDNNSYDAPSSDTSSQYPSDSYNNPEDTISDNNTISDNQTQNLPSDYGSEDNNQIQGTETFESNNPDDNLLNPTNSESADNNQTLEDTLNNNDNNNTSTGISNQQDTQDNNTNTTTDNSSTDYTNNDTTTNDNITDTDGNTTDTGYNNTPTDDTTNNDYLANDGTNNDTTNNNTTDTTNTDNNQTLEDTLNNNDNNNTSTGISNQQDTQDNNTNTTTDNSSTDYTNNDTTTNDNTTNTDGNATEPTDTSNDTNQNYSLEYILDQDGNFVGASIKGVYAFFLDQGYSVPFDITIKFSNQNLSNNNQELDYEKWCATDCTEKIEYKESSNDGSATTNLSVKFDQDQCRVTVEETDDIKYIFYAFSCTANDKVQLTAVEGAAGYEGGSPYSAEQLTNMYPEYLQLVMEFVDKVNQENFGAEIADIVTIIPQLQDIGTAYANSDYENMQTSSQSVYDLEQKLSDREITQISAQFMRGYDTVNDNYNMLGIELNSGNNEFSGSIRETYDSSNETISFSVGFSNLNPASYDGIYYLEAYDDNKQFIGSVAGSYEAQAELSYDAGTGHMLIPTAVNQLTVIFDNTQQGEWSVDGQTKTMFNDNTTFQDAVDNTVPPLMELYLNMVSDKLK